MLLTKSWKNCMLTLIQPFCISSLTLWGKFNDLLQENEQILPKKGELLNTELRIFALITSWY